jgi:hypothetical protein
MKSKPVPKADFEPEDEMKRVTRALALLRQSIDDRIRYWAEWNDAERQLELPFSSVGDNGEHSGRTDSLPR